MYRGKPMSDTKGDIYINDDYFIIEQHAEPEFATPIIETTLKSGVDSTESFIKKANELAGFEWIGKQIDHYTHRISCLVSRERFNLYTHPDFKYAYIVELLSHKYSCYQRRGTWMERGYGYSRGWHDIFEDKEVI